MMNQSFSYQKQLGNNAFPVKHISAFLPKACVPTKDITGPLTFNGVCLSDCFKMSKYKIIPVSSQMLGMNSTFVDVINIFRDERIQFF